MIKFDTTEVEKKTSEIVDKVFDSVVAEEVSRHFGAVMRYGQLEIDAFTNREASRDFVNNLLKKKACMDLYVKFTFAVKKWLERSKKACAMITEKEQEIIARWTKENDYETKRLIDSVVETAATEHAKRDFLAILHKVGDNLQKEVDTNPLAE